MGKIAYLALATALLCATVSAEWLWSNAIFGSPQSLSCDIPQNNLDWIIVCAVTIVVAVMIDAGLWALSGVLSTPKYAEFLKAHLYLAIETAVILGVLVGSIIGLQNFGVADIDTARAYSIIIRNTAMTDFGGVLMVSTFTSMFTNIVPQFRPFGAALGGLSLSFHVAPMFRPIYDTLGLLIQLITTTSVAWFAHEFMLCFVKNSMLTTLLPIGIFLRVLGLKGGGNALIGIALALYFIYPFMLIQIGNVVTNHVQGQIGQFQGTTIWGPLPQCANKPICCIGPDSAVYPDIGSSQYIPNGLNADTDNTYRVNVTSVLRGPAPVIFQGGTPSVSAGATCAYNTVIGSGVNTVIEAVKRANLPSVVLLLGGGSFTFLLSKTLNLQFMAVALAIPMVTFAYIAAYHTVYFVFVVSILLPIFTIFITITFAREIARALGTEIDLSALEKLI